VCASPVQQAAAYVPTLGLLLNVASFRPVPVRH